jgi:ketosteroid isomerase-like protein
MRRHGAGAVAWILSLVGCALPLSKPVASIDADKAAIETVNRKTLQALNEGNLQLMNEMVAPNHIMMIPNRPALIGKDAITASNRNLVATWNDVEIWKPAETVVAGDWAYQRGAYDITLTPKKSGGRSIHSVGKYIHIYQRQPDGSWMMIRDMFNSDAPDGAL